MRIAFGTVLVGLALLPGLSVEQVSGQTTKSGTSKTSPGKNTPPANGNKTWGGKTLEQWMQEIKHSDASKRSMALLALINFGDSASLAVPLVIEHLSDSDVGVRAKAALILRVIRIEGPDVPKVVMALAKRISPEYESQAIIRYEAAKSLGRLVAFAKEAIPWLVKGSHDKSSWEIRQLCVSILWRTAIDAKASPDPRAVQGLLDWLPYERTYQVRLEILQGLTMMGKPTNPALLGREINDMSLCVRTRNTDRKPLVIWAHAALATLTEAPRAKAMVTIAGYLTDKKQSLEVRAQAAYALGTLGPIAKSKVPVLLSMLQDKEAVVVNGVCLALTRIADKSDTVVDALLDVLKHKDPQRATSAVKALVDLKLNIPKVTGAMDKLRENKELDRNLRIYIEDGLKELKKPSK